MMLLIPAFGAETPLPPLGESPLLLFRHSTVLQPLSEYCLRSAPDFGQQRLQHVDHTNTVSAMLASSTDVCGGVQYHHTSLPLVGYRSTLPKARLVINNSPDRSLSCFFFFNDTATTEIYTLSLHDALPI